MPKKRRPQLSTFKNKGDGSYGTRAKKSPKQKKYRKNKIPKWYLLHYIMEEFKKGGNLSGSTNSNHWTNGLLKRGGPTGNIPNRKSRDVGSIGQYPVKSPCHNEGEVGCAGWNSNWSPEGSFDLPCCPGLVCWGDHLDSNDIIKLDYEDN